MGRGAGAVGGTTRRGAGAGGRTTGAGAGAHRSEAREPPAPPVPVPVPEPVQGLPGQRSAVVRG